MQFLKADTAVKVVIGPFVDVTDGFTPETGITLSGADEAEVLKYDNATTVDISGATWAALTGVDGYYHLSLTSSHTDTEGYLSVIVQDDSVCLPVRNDFMVVNANVYDSLFAAAATDYLQVDAIQISGNATAADNLEEGAGAIITGTADADGTLSDVTMSTSLDATHTTSNTLNGRVVIFDGNTTAAIKGCSRVISTYSLTNGQVTWTTALPAAVQAGDTFQIV